MSKRVKTRKSDAELIQGLWRVVSYISRGGRVGSGSTHYQFDGNRVKEITPSLVDGGSWATFELDPTTQPKRLTVTYEWAGKDGKTVSRVHREAYELDGDTLRICIANVWGNYPDVVSDKEHSVITLVRDHGPPPETKRSAGKKPRRDRILGEVVWDDNFDHWDATIDLSSGHTITLHLEPGERTDEATIDAGREFLGWLRKHEAGARRYAAQQLLDTHNDNWNHGKAISARTFASRMKLETVALSPDGSSSFYYHDGNLFWGHCIIVQATSAREFEDASIAG